MNPIVCSFYTEDEYYGAHAEKLRARLDKLGIEHEIRAVKAEPGQDWADICRQKIPFLAEVCAANPGRRVFWIDVDCIVTDLPDWVANSSADLVGFQRGFASPLSIGYERRTRFWEPCFFGISPSPRGRRFIEDAAALERKSQLKATDDYFFEEAWRANAAGMSFQIIPSTAVVGDSAVAIGENQPFFSFGSSGKVAEFKGRVVQHTPVGGGARVSWRSKVQRRMLRLAKRVEGALPQRLSRSLRRMSDSSGLTGQLTGATSHDVHAVSPERKAAISGMITVAQRGDLVKLAERRAAFESTGIVSDRDKATIRAAEGFAHYATTGEGDPLPLAWWPRPFPGNFGDWLSPMIVNHVSGRPLKFVSPTGSATSAHMVGLGSIGRFVKKSSTVVGTGVSTLDVELVPNANWVSVRGPLTAQALRDSGGPAVDRFGDPGVLLRRVVPLTRGKTNGRTALVRHYTHVPVPVSLPDEWDELSVYAGHPDDVKALLATLIQYDRVVTSAMHIMITCHSYGIPCALVTFEGREDAVHGSGMKYEDYALGAGIQGLRGPHVVGADLSAAQLDDVTLDITLSDELLDDVTAALHEGAALNLDRLAR